MEGKGNTEVTSRSLCCYYYQYYHLPVRMSIHCTWFAVCSPTSVCDTKVVVQLFFHCNVVAVNEVVEDLI